MKDKISRSVKALIRYIFCIKEPEINMPAQIPNIWGTAGRTEIMIARNRVRMKPTRK